MAQGSASAGSSGNTFGTGFDKTVVIAKASDESLTSSQTLQDDDELTFAAGSSEKWQFEAVLFFTANASGGAKATVAYSGTNSTNYVNAQMLVATDFDNETGVLGTSAGKTSATLACRINGYVLTTTSGNIKVQWAQNSSNGSATTCKAGSYMILRRFI